MSTKREDREVDLDILRKRREAARRGREERIAREPGGYRSMEELKKALLKD